MLLLVLSLLIIIILSTTIIIVGMIRGHGITRKSFGLTDSPDDTIEFEGGLLPLEGAPISFLASLAGTTDKPTDEWDRPGRKPYP